MVASLSSYGLVSPMEARSPVMLVLMLIVVAGPTNMLRLGVLLLGGLLLLLWLWWRLEGRISWILSVGIGQGGDGFWL